MTQSSVFIFHPCHVGLTNNLVFVFNKAGIDLVAIRDVEITFPGLDNVPQRFERFSSVFPYEPTREFPE